MSCNPEGACSGGPEVAVPEVTAGLRGGRARRRLRTGSLSRFFSFVHLGRSCALLRRRCSARRTQKFLLVRRNVKSAPVGAREERSPVLSGQLVLIFAAYEAHTGRYARRPVV